MKPVRRVLKDKKWDCYFKCSSNSTVNDSDQTLKKCPSQTLHGCEGFVMNYIIIKLSKEKTI